MRECLLFDPTGKDLAGVGKELWGFALTPERREPLAEQLLPNGERGVRSAVLGLVAYVAERTPPAAPNETWALAMRWPDPAAAADIPDYDQARATERNRIRWHGQRALAGTRRHERSIAPWPHTPSTSGRSKKTTLATAAAESGGPAAPPPVVRFPPRASLTYILVVVSLTPRPFFAAGQGSPQRFRRQGRP